MTSLFPKAKEFISLLFFNLVELVTQLALVYRFAHCLYKDGKTFNQKLGHLSILLDFHF